MSERHVPVRSQFQVRDSNGDERTLHATTDAIISTHMDGKKSVRSGLPEFRTADGRRVNKLNDGRFQVVETGEILEPVDSPAL